MIRHIVFFTARDPQDVDRIAAELRMLGGIPHCDVLEVGANLKVDRIGDEVDVVVYGEFRDDAALAAFKDHPIYAECTRRVRPLREMRVAADVRSGVPARTQRSG